MNKILRYSFVALMAMVMGNVYADDITDALTWEGLGLDGASSSYNEFSGKTVTSSAVYAGTASSGQGQYIQLRTKNSNEGIITTTSGGKLKSVTISFNAKTTDRAIEIYGKNEAYASAADLYGDAKGTLLKSIAANENTKTLIVEGDYAFVGLKSANGAIYVDKIEITWEGSAAPQTTGQVWDFTVLPTQVIDGTGNMTCNIDGGVLPDDEGAGWGIIYNNAGIADGTEFMAKAGEVFEPTKGLKWSALPNEKMVIYRNYPVEYNGKPQGGRYLFTNKACEVMIPAKAGQVIEIIAGTAKNNKKITSQDVVETFETSDGEVLKGALVDGTTNFDYKPYTLTVAIDNPYISFENNIAIQKITVKDAGDTPAEGGMAWNFTNWSDATVAALKAEAAKGISGGTWSDVESETKTSEWPKDKCYWQVAVQPNDLKAGDVEIIETKGLKFTNTSDRALAIAVNYPLADQDESKAFGPYHGGAYLWLGGKNINYFIIPNVAAGSVIEMGVESHKITDARGVKLFAGTDETGTELKAPDGTDVAYPKTYTEQKWQMPADATTTDVCVRNNNGCHIYFIKVVSDASGISTVKAQKVQNGAIYNLAGQKVGKDYKGIVIVNGRKYIQK